MKINGEPVEKVTSFESLRAGDVAWLLSCLVCGSRERMLLTRFDPAIGGVDVDGVFRVEPGWRYQPPSRCDVESGRGGFLTARAVARGAVYRVVLDLSEPTEVTEEKTKERVE